MEEPNKRYWAAWAINFGLQYYFHDPAVVVRAPYIIRSPLLDVMLLNPDHCVQLLNNFVFLNYDVMDTLPQLLRFSRE